MKIIVLALSLICYCATNSDAQSYRFYGNNPEFTLDASPSQIILIDGASLMRTTFRQSNIQWISGDGFFAIEATDQVISIRAVVKKGVCIDEVRTSTNFTHSIDIVVESFGEDIIKTLYTGCGFNTEE